MLLISAIYSPVWYDDAGHFLVAKSATEGSEICYPLNSEGLCEANSPFITMGPVLSLPISIWLRLFGADMFTARILMLILSLGFAFVFFRLAKFLGDEIKALIAVGIISLNIQFLTYGAEVLGEVPMMAAIFLGVLCLLKWQSSGKWFFAFAGLVAFLVAVSIKEYALLPISLSILFWWILAIHRKGKHIFILGLAWALLAACLFLILHGGFRGTMAYLEARKSYGSEFLAFNFPLSLKFLAFKPLFWLGTIALILKWRVKQRPADFVLLSVHLAWLIFFMLSDGYDRFGMLLLFIPAIYLADFGPYLWKEAGRRKSQRIWKRAALLLIAIAVFAQKTPLIFANRIANPEMINFEERAIAEEIAQYPDKVIFVFDQQIIPFFHKTTKWQAVSFVPSNSAACTDFSFLEKCELLVAGPYAFTEYDNCIPWQHFQSIFEVEGVGGKWQILKRLH